MAITCSGPCLALFARKMTQKWAKNVIFDIFQNIPTRHRRPQKYVFHRNFSQNLHKLRFRAGLVTFFPESEKHQKVRFAYGSNRLWYLTRGTKIRKVAKIVGKCPIRVGRAQITT